MTQETPLITGSPKAIRLATVLVTSLFFFWGIVNNSLPAVIPKVQEACSLNDIQAGFVASAFWIAYFVMPYPAALIMRRYGFRGAIVVGLGLGAAGCGLFVAAASTVSYAVFLLAPFVLSSGMAFLETAANPYISVLGDPARAPHRLNLAQTFNGIAAFISALWLSKLILGTPRHDAPTMLRLRAEDLPAYQAALAEDARSVIPVFLVIGALLLAAAFVFSLAALPDSKDHRKSAGESEEEKSLLSTLLANRYFLCGVAAQFAYVGAQVGVDDFFLRYIPSVTGMARNDATTYLGLILGCFMLGRVVGTSLMTRIDARSLLGAFAAVNVVLLLYCGLAPERSSPTFSVAVPSFLMLGDRLVFTSHPAPYVLMAVKFFMSIMFPTIFSLALSGLGRATKLGAMLLVMSIVGGAILPPIMGLISRITGTFAFSYLAPMVCMVGVLAFSFLRPREVARG